MKRLKSSALRRYLGKNTHMSKQVATHIGSYDDDEDYELISKRQKPMFASPSGKLVEEPDGFREDDSYDILKPDNYQYRDMSRRNQRELEDYEDFADLEPDMRPRAGRKQRRRHRKLRSKDALGRADVNKLVGKPQGAGRTEREARRAKREKRRKLAYEDEYFFDNEPDEESVLSALPDNMAMFQHIRHRPELNVERLLGGNVSAATSAPTAPKVKAAFPFRCPNAHRENRRCAGVQSHQALRPGAGIEEMAGIADTQSVEVATLRKRTRLASALDEFLSFSESETTSFISSPRLPAVAAVARSARKHFKKTRGGHGYRSWRKDLGLYESTGDENSGYYYEDSSDGHKPVFAGPRIISVHPDDAENDVEYEKLNSDTLYQKVQSDQEKVGGWRPLTDRQQGKLAAGGNGSAASNDSSGPQPLLQFMQSNEESHERVPTAGHYPEAQMMMASSRDTDVKRPKRKGEDDYFFGNDVENSELAMFPNGLDMFRHFRGDAMMKMESVVGGNASDYNGNGGSTYSPRGPLTHYRFPKPRYDDSFETTLQARSRGIESVRYTPTSYWLLKAYRECGEEALKKTNCSDDDTLKTHLNYFLDASLNRHVASCPNLTSLRFLGRLSSCVAQARKATRCNMEVKELGDFVYLTNVVQDKKKTLLQHYLKLSLEFHGQLLGKADECL
ncbi:hypothetical protein HPB47_022677 [Ixodes persulcatus]|uniref:Uncharacterized protein n=1 Tax=Ixodes persulcatus TaxID=34615 RepID=A0AC60QCE9_IXOPE|nr:hypothetical protein HPB47_022677 [Ixodes persulcatus]